MSMHYDTALEVTGEQWIENKYSTYERGRYEPFIRALIVDYGEASVFYDHAADAGDDKALEKWDLFSYEIMNTILENVFGSNPENEEAENEQPLRSEGNDHAH